MNDSLNWRSKPMHLLNIWNDGIDNEKNGLHSKKNI
jgi:hypothetical protein